MTESHGINSGKPNEAEREDDMPLAPESAREKGLDGHDVEVIGSMITSDPPSTNMGESSEDLP